MKNIDIKPKTIFLALLALIIVQRIFFLIHYSSSWVGSDDLIYWLGSTDYSKGIFHEPFFYGQNYNFMLEAFLASPLVKFGISPALSLGISTSFVGLFPYIFIGSFLYLKKQTLAAFVFLTLPLVLSIPFDLLISMPRGFANGIFFTAFLIYPIWYPKKKSSFIILGSFVALAYIINPNSLLFTFPVCLYLWFVNWKNISFYLLPLVTAIPWLVIQYFSRLFYEKNPEHLVHYMMDLEFHWSKFFDGFQHLDHFFKHLTPIYFQGHWMILILLFILGIFLIRKHKQKGLSILLALLFTLVLMGVNKVGDGKGTVFLSASRMFLVLPLLLGLTFFWLGDFDRKFKSQLPMILLGLGVIFTAFKGITYESKITHLTKDKNFGPVAVKSMKDLKDECTEFAQLSEKYDVDLIIYTMGKNPIDTSQWMMVPDMEFFNYGCPLVLDQMTPSVMNIYEKRTWIYTKERETIRERIFLVNSNPKNPEEKLKQVRYSVIKESPYVLLIENNDKTLDELSKIFEFPLQRNVYY